MEIEKLDYVSVREVWNSEPRDFTKWLANNVDILSEALDLQMPLVSPDTESAVGSFLADLVLEDESGEQVVVECQLEESDHKHLGQILTYVTNLEAKIGIWICTNARAEHARAVSWLNEVSPVDTYFYLVNLKTVRISDSTCAPLFNVIAGPSEESKKASMIKKQDAERHRLRYEFWTQLLEKCQARETLFQNISPGKFGHIQKGSGFARITYRYIVSYEYVAVDLYIDIQNPELNKEILDRLEENKAKIEQEFGENLIWDYEEGRRACKVRWTRRDVGLRDREDWPKIHDDMIQHMKRFHHAIDVPLKNIMRELNQDA